LEDVFEMIVSIGGMTEREAQAKMLAAQYRDVVDEVKKRSRSLRPLRVYCLVSAAGRYAVGSDPLINEILLAAGGTNVFSDNPGRFFSPETADVARLDPEVIFTPLWPYEHQDGIPAPDEELLWKGLEAVSAVANNRVYCYDPNILVKPGPRTASAVKQLFERLHA
jgi:iron complex transport system substrate-binding protein